MPEFIWVVECETSYPTGDGRSVDTAIATFTTLEAGRKWLDRLAEKVADSEDCVIKHRDLYTLTYSTKHSTNGYSLFQLPLYTEEDIDGSTQ